MTRTIVEGRRDDRLRVLIAGAGVAGLEALLALRALAGDRVAIEMVAPDTAYVERPLAVAEPFGLASARSWPLAPIVREQGARLHADALAAVEPASHAIRTAGGARLRYDVLVLAIGARRLPALPGALTFDGPAGVARMTGLLGELERGETGRVAFAVPHEVAWALPLYELALMTAAHLERRRRPHAELAVVTHETEPLGAFGSAGSTAVRRLLDRAGVELHCGRVPLAAEPGRLLLEGAAPIRAERVLALPALDVPAIAGLPQGTRGFIPTDGYQRVQGAPDVYAVGDATSFPIKQGGLAAQQADVAARSLAARAGAPVAARPWSPTLRAVLLAGEDRCWLRSGGRAPHDTSAAGPDALWWPPSKVAAPHLAPYLARAAGDTDPVVPLCDLEEPRTGEREDPHAAVELALEAAEAAAGWGDRPRALRWLEVAEQIGVALPPEYVEKRAAWSAGRLAARRD